MNLFDSELSIVRLFLDCYRRYKSRIKLQSNRCRIGFYQDDAFDLDIITSDGFYVSTFFIFDYKDNSLVYPGCENEIIISIEDFLQDEDMILILKYGRVFTDVNLLDNFNHNSPTSEILSKEDILEVSK